MSFCPVPRAANEIERLMALFAYEALYTEPEAPFDELTQLAGRVCESPMSLFPDRAEDATALSVLPIPRCIAQKWTARTGFDFFTAQGRK